MNTHLAREWLSGYLDGQVSAGERRQVEAHLAGCAACRQDLNGLRRTATLVRTLPPVAAPAILRSAVRARLTPNHTPAGTRVRPWAQSLSRPTWRLALAAAAILVIGLFTINLLQPMMGARDAREGIFRRDVPAQSVDATGQAESPVSAQRVGIPENPPAAQLPGAPGPRFIFDRYVIRSADLQVEVPKFDEASDALIAIAEDAGGFVADTTVTQQEPPSGVFVLRVPAGRFTHVLERVEGLGRVTERRVTGQDITEEYVDLQARIRNLQTHERQLLTFMGRANRVSDLLAIEQELSRVRGEIEQLTGRVRFLANRVELATVRVALREKAKQGSSLFWDFTASLQHVRAAFLGTVRQLLAATEWLVVAMSALVPLALLAVLGWGALRWLLRRRASAV